MAEFSLLFSVPYERRSAEQKDRITALMSRRKRKRKKKLPKTSSSCGRARRRQRQWHARDAGFPGDVSPGMEQKNSYVLLYAAPRTVFPSLSSGPRCPASWTRRILACARLDLLVFDDVFRAVLLLVVSSPRCPSSWPAWTTGQLCGGSQVQLLDEVVVPVVCNNICPGPAVHHFGGAAGAAHHQGHLHPCRDAEFDPHGSDCSPDH